MRSQRKRQVTRYHHNTSEGIQHDFHVKASVSLCYRALFTASIHLLPLQVQLVPFRNAIDQTLLRRQLDELLKVHATRSGEQLVGDHLLVDSPSMGPFLDVAGFAELDSDDGLEKLVEHGVSVGTCQL